MCKARWVPTARPSDLVADRLSVTLDATPLLGSPTGVGAFCTGALGGLAARGDVSTGAYAVSWRRRRGIEGLVPPGVSTVQRPMPARPLHRAWRLGRYPPLEWFVGRHDVVHGTNFVVPPTAHAARVVTVHDLTVVLYPELCDPPTLRFPDLVRRAVAEGAFVHTPSQYVADEVVAELGVDPAQVRAVHHGVPQLPEAMTGAGSRPPAASALPAGCPRSVLSVGTVEPRKDLPLLVAAFDMVAADHPDVALVIAGGDGWGAAALDAAVEVSPVRDRIVRTGYLDATGLATVLRSATVLAYPSRYEGFGFPPLQAMAAGVPVVATGAGAVPEVVGDAALVVPVGDRDALAAALAAVLGGGFDVEALVERGRRRSATFTWASCADGLVSLYREAMRTAVGAARAR